VTNVKLEVNMGIGHKEKKLSEALAIISNSGKD
jgi:hypothetical protein